ncbi:helix-turn-helix domain-containing protein [Aureibacillus halotolerans]|uniref:DNA-binding XRE family transcriptional regulator n=1 Tax=Aureibacillus halotolerans TaxID=1508390 RepID=A0A4R6TVF5_9BACI|nr:helix-turn-helix transcriptional regulator [Aureibacillus halotolerans]TDQ35236.1 DNA-binding XRE family transcriptional regulator [Aureibacillus halotolerans]
MSLGEKISRLRKKNNLSQQDLADKIKISKSSLGMYEIDKRQPNYATLQKISNHFGVTVDYLLNEDEEEKSDQEKMAQKDDVLTDKDERDIARRMKKMREDLMAGNDTEGLSFSGEPMSEEAIESLLEALEYAERQTTRINKKYIPKKHRKNDDKL